MESGYDLARLLDTERRDESQLEMRASCCVDSSNDAGWPRGFLSLWLLFAGQLAPITGMMCIVIDTPSHFYFGVGS